ncbi:MAG: carotenoid oxygenase family protein [Rhizobiales bacterium]|nr:carotenoid oxygenase family protein [Hyphomicrobiales bacterium]
MDRRTFTKMLIGLMTASALPTYLQAKTPLGDQASFLRSLEKKPWLLGYLGTRETELHANLRIVSGYVPSDLRGHLFRNGPAQHNLGPDRFAHWFDAPGMVQRFTFSDNKITHYGRLVETARNVAETNAGHIKFSGFGTHGHDLTSGGSADGQNTGNISLIKHAGELLALWEGGSPHIINPETLETEGRKSWLSDTQGLPFGAHPRVDQDGSLWNLGYSVNPAALILYHISVDGQLLKTHVLPQTATPMVHDFMITATKIVIIAPPYTASNPAGDAFVDLFKWRAAEPTKVLIIDKADLTNVTLIDIEPFWVFHFGNAYDIGTSEIGFDFALHDDPSFMTKDAFAAMDGSWDGGASAASRYVQARINLKSKTVRLDKAPEFGQVEFIQTDARENLSSHRHALMLAQPGGASVFGFNRLVLVDRNTGNASSFDVGETEILEEHLIVPKPRIENEFWIIGTALDWQKGTTNLSVYDGSHLSDGPIMKAEMDLALPLGLHGTFIPAVGY